MRGVLIDLSASLASWSEGGAAYRPSDAVPTWSATVGLIGAAFGWGREDERLVRFASDFACAVLVEKSGHRMVDYHTVQTPHVPALKGHAIVTRLDELTHGVKPGEDRPHTTPTRREYMSDVRYRLLVAPLVTPPWVSADDIAAAVSAPVFPLYLGRRSCLPSEVIAEVVEAECVEDVLHATHWDPRLPTRRTPMAVRERRDLLTSLAPRRFDLRSEAMA